MLRRGIEKERGASMGELIVADDGLPAEADVGDWVRQKHQHLITYLKLHAHPRARFIGLNGPGATYIDIFCGPGRARIKSTGEFVDGSAVAAWKASVEQKAPFSHIYVADKDEPRRAACTERLVRLGAPVIPVAGDAQSATRTIVRKLDPYGFISPLSIPTASAHFGYRFCKT
jgi:three-Cys-motif partner protein